MKISEVLSQVRAFTDYIQLLAGDTEKHGGQALTRWDYIIGVYGPTPVLWPRGLLGSICHPLQAVTLGWDGCNDVPQIRPGCEEICAALELSLRDYTLINNATFLIQPWNPRLRADLIAACGLPAEQETPWFKKKEKV
jgi:hypothetical protein